MKGQKISVVPEGYLFSPSQKNQGNGISLPCRNAEKWVLIKIMRCSESEAASTIKAPLRD